MKYHCWLSTAFNQKQFHVSPWLLNKDLVSRCALSVCGPDNWNTISLNFRFNSLTDNVMHSQPIFIHTMLCYLWACVCLSVTIWQMTTQLNSTQPEITDAGVNTFMSASLCSYFFKKNIISLWLLLIGFRYQEDRMTSFFWDIYELIWLFSTCSTALCDKLLHHSYVFYSNLSLRADN